MPFFKNTTMKKAIAFSSVILFFLLLLNTVLTYYSSHSVKNDVSELKEEIVPHTFRFIELKIDVIQIQQWLTDASATKDKESLNEAEKYYIESIKMINFMIKVHREYRESEMVVKLSEFKINVDKYYELGLLMANAYITEGTEAWKCLYETT